MQELVLDLIGWHGVCVVNGSSDGQINIHLRLQNKMLEELSV